MGEIHGALASSENSAPSADHPNTFFHPPNVIHGDTWPGIVEIVDCPIENRGFSH